MRRTSSTSPSRTWRTSTPSSRAVTGPACSSRHGFGGRSAPRTICQGYASAPFVIGSPGGSAQVEPSVQIVVVSAEVQETMAGVGEEDHLLLTGLLGGERL